MGHFVYILKSAGSGKYYVGSSENPERRLEFHNSLEKGFTSRYRPWQLVYQKEYATKKEGMEKERTIKKRKSRKYIEDLIAGRKQL